MTWPVAWSKMVPIQFDFGTIEAQRSQFFTKRLFPLIAFQSIGKFLNMADNELWANLLNLVKIMVPLKKDPKQKY